MHYNEQARVLPEIEAKARRDIGMLDTYLDKMRGTLVCLENTHYHKERYSDTDASYRLSIYQPNLGATNAPGIRVITEEDAKTIARILCGPFVDKKDAKWHETRLESIRPVTDPAGVRKDEFKSHDGIQKSPSWELRIITPSTE